MPRVSQLITEEVAALAEKSLKELGKASVLARKLQAICAAKKHGIKKIAEIYDISRTTLTGWISNFKSGSLTALTHKPKKPRSPITAEHKILIKKWLEQENRMTINALYHFHVLTEHIVCSANTSHFIRV
jgi:transposase